MKNNKRKVLVFGCTGTVGRYVLEQLTTENCEVVGVLRNSKREHPTPLSRATNLSYVVADLEDISAVEAACTGIDTIFLLTATHPKQVSHESNVIQAAKEQGVSRIVKLSAPNIEPQDLVEVGKWHRKIEAELEESGIEYCCLRPYAFMQNWERNTFTIRHFGKFYGAMKDASRNYVDARDVAEIAVRFLLMESPILEKMVTITGPESIDYHSMAEKLTAVSGQTISYIETSSDRLRKILLRRAKLPAWLVNHIVELDELAIKIPEPQTTNVDTFLGRAPRRMDAYLNESKSAFSKISKWQLLRSMFHSISLVLIFSTYI